MATVDKSPVATELPIDDQIPVALPYAIPFQSYPPPPPPIQSGVRGPWSTGLCDCCSDCSICCLTWWCPCITFGRIAEIVDKGSTSCGVSGTRYLLACIIGIPCIYSCFYRSKMRKQYGLAASPCCDCFAHFCCERCALCQEYRELKHRGFDMSIGWNQNIEKQNRGVAMSVPPFVQGGMMR